MKQFRPVLSAVLISGSLVLSSCSSDTPPSASSDSSATVEDFAGVWETIPFREMIEEDIPEVIQQLRDGTLEGLSINPSEADKRELKTALETMSDEEIHEKFFGRLLAMADQYEMKFIIELKPPKAISTQMLVNGEVAGYLEQEGSFELKDDEIFVRTEDEITIFKILDHDTLKTPNDQKGKIPKYLTLKRKAP